SEIPIASGLGSSAAAIVAGLVAADHMYELDAPLLEHAARIEGHPDNVAAALLGGFVICADGGAERFEPAPGIEAALAIPPEPVPTAEARAALPAEVPLEDAVYNAAHAALLVLGLARGDLDLVARGLDDRLHQPRRERLYPRSMELLRRARELGAVGASISGAGPAVLFWCHWQQTGTLIEHLREVAPDCGVRQVVVPQLRSVVEDRDPALRRLRVADRLPDDRVEDAVGEALAELRERFPGVDRPEVGDVQNHAQPLEVGVEVLLGQLDDLE